MRRPVSVPGRTDGRRDAALRLAAGWLLLASALGPRAAYAGDVFGLEQPDVEPRHAVVVQPARVFIDPRLPAADAGLRTVSLPNLVRSAERQLAADPRFRVSDEGFVADLLDQSRVPAIADLLYLAQQSARIGAEYYRGYNLASAESELLKAIEIYERTPEPWLNPRSVSILYRELALIYLELAQADEANAVSWRAEAVVAFGRMIRLDPSLVIDARSYPESVVETYLQAYVSQLAEGGESLGMSVGEARRLGDLLEAEWVANLFAVVESGARPVVWLQLFDRQSGEFAFNGPLEEPPGGGDLEDALSLELSALVGCQELELLQPPRPPDTERGTAYLNTSYSGGYFTQTPTRQGFGAHGVNITVSWLFSENAGLYLSGAHWISPSDPAGDLIGNVDSTRIGLGLVSAFRFRRARVFGLGGLEVGRHGSIRATRSFWCKVSEGEPQVFDAIRRCDSDDVTNSGSGVAGGLQFGAGADVLLAGPVWFHLQTNVTLYVLPFDERAINLPIYGEAGLTYRF